MVQIRDMETHKPLPGVIVGDIGPKAGYNTKDNGFLAFNHVRIPNSHLLQRYLTVDPTGYVRTQGNPKIHYASMMLVRKIINYGYVRGAAQSMTITIRYSIVR
jgi:acyl-CoA oxidase